MADESFESECNRAELLGLQAPDRAQWESTNTVNKTESNENDISEESKTQESEPQAGEPSEPRSKIEELNNIFSMTHVHLDKFKKACGSLTNLLKIRGPEDNPENPITSDNTNEGGGVNIDQDLEKLQ